MNPEGEHVRTDDGREGYCKFSVPGNGTIRWYIVEFEDGSEDRFTEDQLTII